MEVNLYNTNKKYNVIYADPPWSYQQWCNKKQGAAKAHYETMKQKDIEELPVERIADKNCILFMWATFPKLQEALATIKAWGFEYKTIAFVWDKMVHNPGRYTLSQTEFVLAFKRGKFPQPRGARNIKQMVHVHRGLHSVKPKEVILGITQMFPEQTKIELFARNNYIGWDNWGLEIPNSKIEITSNLEKRMLSQQILIK